MSVLGLTLDYGPFGTQIAFHVHYQLNLGFMDRYDPDHICNTSDDGGRYRYREQPDICKWNLERFCEALAPHIDAEQGKELVAKS